MLTQALATSTSCYVDAQRLTSLNPLIWHGTLASRNQCLRIHEVVNLLNPSSRALGLGVRGSKPLERVGGNPKPPKPTLSP